MKNKNASPDRSKPLPLPNHKPGKTAWPSPAPIHRGKSPAPDHIANIDANPARHGRK